MAIKAVQCLNTAATLLNDTGNVRYLLADLKKYFNEAQKEIVKLDLQANATRESVALAAGTKQSLPDGSLGLIRMTRNMGVAGTTAGKAIRKISRDVLDRLYPEWHEADNKTETKFYVYDIEESRLTFDVYPPAPGYYVEIIHGEVPDVVSDFNTTNILHDRYEADIVEYILYRAKSMHKEYAGEAGEAVLHLRKFETGVAGKITKVKK